MCPGRGRVPGRNVSGPTHRSAPTESIAIPSKPGGTGGDGAPPLPGYQGCQAAGRCGHRPLRGEGKAQSTALASGAERIVCGADARDRRRVRQRASPKCPATSDNPSVAAKPRQLPLHKGALACGGRGGHRPAIGVPSNPRRGGTEPAPYTSTESADLWADVPKAWLPPAKFRSEIWLAVIGIGPYERTRGYGFPRRFAPRNDSTNAGSRSAGPSSTSFSARRSVRNDRRHRSLPLSSHVSTSPVNACSEAPAPVSPKSPVNSGKVSKGRAEVLPLVVSRGSGGYSFHLKRIPPSGSGPPPARRTARPAGGKSRRASPAPPAGCLSRAARRAALTPSPPSGLPGPGGRRSWR